MFGKLGKRPIKKLETEVKTLQLKEKSEEEEVLHEQSQVKKIVKFVKRLSKQLP